MDLTNNNNVEKIKEFAKKIIIDPLGLYSTRIYIYVIISLFVISFIFYIGWEFSDKETQTCKNTINNIKEFYDLENSLDNAIPLKISQENKRIVDISGKEAWVGECDADAENIPGNGYNKHDQKPICGPVKLRDHFYMGSFNSVGCGDEWNSYVNKDVLIKILEAGIRVVDFELFLTEENNSQPFVGIGIPDDNSKYYFKGSYNQIAFSDIINTLKDYVDKSAENYKENPLFVNLRIKTTDMSIYKKLEEVLSLDDIPLPDEKYSIRQQLKNDPDYKNIIDSPLMDHESKIIFILNDNPINPLGKYIVSLNKNYENKLLRSICITDCDYNGMSNAIIMDSNSIINSTRKQSTINDFKNYLGIALPDWSNIIKNPDFSKLKYMGCQMVLMKFSFDDTNLQEYIKWWKEQDEEKNPRIVVKDKENKDNIEIVKLGRAKPMTDTQSSGLDPDVQSTALSGLKNAGAAFKHYKNRYTGKN